MSLMVAVARPLYGAFRLARFQADGIQHFETTHAAFWFSFVAAVLSFPLHLLLLSALWLDAHHQVSLWRFASLEILTYVIAWLALPNILPLVLRAMNREEHYIRGVVAYNWSMVIQSVIYVPVATLSILGVPNAGFVALMVLLVVLFYGWFVMKNALDISASAAWSIIILDMMISLVLSLWSDNLIYS